MHRIGGVLKQYTDRSIHVAGHTDNVPSRVAWRRSFQQTSSSLKRAQKASSGMTDGGMALDKVEAKGHADSRPIASNSTAEGRQKNRRVEIVVGIAITQ